MTTYRPEFIFWRDNVRRLSNIRLDLDNVILRLAFTFTR